MAKQEIKHISGKVGGYLVGKSHDNGGIKAVNKSTGQPLEMEGGEVVITKPAVDDPRKRKFQGKMMTNREILSYINESGGGVAFEKGGEVAHCKIAKSEYEYGGQVVRDVDMYMSMAKGGELAVVLSEGFEEYDISSLECDGATRVISHILNKNAIPHTVKLGAVSFRDNVMQPHMWIELADGTVIDYKLRMWLGNKAPQGIINPDATEVDYTGREVNLKPVPEVILKTMCASYGELPEKYMDGGVIDSAMRTVRKVASGNPFKAEYADGGNLPKGISDSFGHDATLKTVEDIGIQKAMLLSKAISNIANVSKGLPFLLGDAEAYSALSENLKKIALEQMRESQSSESKSGKDVFEDIYDASNVGEFFANYGLYQKQKWLLQRDVDKLFRDVNDMLQNTLRNGRIMAIAAPLVLDSLLRSVVLGDGSSDTTVANVSELLSKTLPKSANDRVAELSILEHVFKNGFVVRQASSPIMFTAKTFSDNEVVVYVDTSRPIYTCKFAKPLIGFDYEAESGEIPRDAFYAHFELEFKGYPFYVLESHDDIQRTYVKSLRDEVVSIYSFAKMYENLSPEQCKELVKSSMSGIFDGLGYGLQEVYEGSVQASEKNNKGGTPYRPPSQYSSYRTQYEKDFGGGWLAVNAALQDTNKAHYILVGEENRIVSKDPEVLGLRNIKLMSTPNTGFSDLVDAEPLTIEDYKKIYLSEVAKHYCSLLSDSTSHGISSLDARINQDYASPQLLSHRVSVAGRQTKMLLENLLVDDSKTDYSAESYYKVTLDSDYNPSEPQEIKLRQYFKENRNVYFDFELSTSDDIRERVINSGFKNEFARVLRFKFRQAAYSSNGNFLEGFLFRQLITAGAIQWLDYPEKVEKFKGDDIVWSNANMGNSEEINLTTVKMEDISYKTINSKYEDIVAIEPIYTQAIFSDSVLSMIVVASDQKANYSIAKSMLKNWYTTYGISLYDTLSSYNYEALSNLIDSDVERYEFSPLPMIKANEKYRNRTTQWSLDAEATNGNVPLTATGWNLFVSVDAAYTNRHNSRNSLALAKSDILFYTPFDYLLLSAGVNGSLDRNMRWDGKDYEFIGLTRIPMESRNSLKLRQTSRLMPSGIIECFATSAKRDKIRKGKTEFGTLLSDVFKFIGSNPTDKIANLWTYTIPYNPQRYSRDLDTLPKVAIVNVSIYKSMQDLLANKNGGNPNKKFIETS